MAGTAEPVGRIRIREPQAQIYWGLLWMHHGNLIHARWLAKQDGRPVIVYQRAIARIDSMKAELMRTADEMGWELGLDERWLAPEGTGPDGAAQEREPMGGRPRFGE